MKTVTKKEHAAWVRMHREWPSQNDAYNVATFGITLARYWELQQAAIDAVGGHGDITKATVSQMNKVGAK